MSGPAPKPAHLRQRTNRRSTQAMLDTSNGQKVPALPNPDGRVWHVLTLAMWKRAWQSPMAGQWLASDADALGQLAILWDEFHKAPDAKTLAEIRLQRQCFGLTPLDRSRLQWEVSRAEEAEAKQRPRMPLARRASGDPRAAFMVVK